MLGLRSVWVWGAVTIIVGCGARTELEHPEAQGEPLEPGRFPRRIAVGNLHACAVVSGGQAVCWGAWHPERGPTSPSYIDSLPRMERLAAGGGHTCGIDLEGGVWCWGGNVYGQLGPNLPAAGSSPRRVPLPAPAMDVTCGEAHSCAVMTTGAVACWGANESMQLGRADASTADAAVVTGCGPPWPLVERGVNRAAAHQGDARQRSLRPASTRAPVPKGCSG